MKPPKQPMTVRDLELALAKIKNKDLPVSLVIEYDSQYEDMLQEVITVQRSVAGVDQGESKIILMGVDRINFDT